LGKGQQVAIEGRLQTRQWDDDRGARHWKTEVVATSVEMLSGRRKRDYEAETLATQAAEPAGISPNEAAEVGVMTAVDAPADEQPLAEDEQVLVLA
jgi:single-strand DNA-binding protein